MLSSYKKCLCQVCEEAPPAGPPLAPARLLSLGVRVCPICVINDPLCPSLNVPSLISFVRPLVSPDTSHQFTGSLLNFPWHVHPVVRISCVSFKSFATLCSFTAQSDFILTFITCCLCLEVTEMGHGWSLSGFVLLFLVFQSFCFWQMHH